MLRLQILLLLCNVLLLGEGRNWGSEDRDEVETSGFSRKA